MRGSTTMCVAPAARPASKNCIAGGIVAAGFEPTSKIVCASAMSAQREGQTAVDAEGAVAPRSPPMTCRTARCSRSSMSAARPGRTCRRRTPSRWSGRRRRNIRSRRGRRLPATSVIPATIRVSASSQEAARNSLVRSPGTSAPAVSAAAADDQEVWSLSSPWSTVRPGLSESPAVAERSPDGLQAC